jgi:hypothetical protein
MLYKGEHGCPVSPVSFAVLMSSLAQAQLRTLTERERDVMLEGAQKTWVKKAQQFEGILSELLSRLL